MGVPKFFRYISERYPCLSELVREYQIPEFDNLYLDMNGIIHNCSHPNDNDIHFRITEEQIFKDIFHYIDALFLLIAPQKLFFMAIDGVAPRAKMNQQRGRRFRSAKDAELLELKAKNKGETLPSEDRFDSNCITPGTPFMARLHEALKYFIQFKISSNPLWQKCRIILSGHETPGEGEHKIMEYIRYLKSKPDFDPNTRHCLYGLDADLIMLGLCTHEAHFSLLREEVKFGKQAKRATSVDETRFYLLHLGLLKEYLELEFKAVENKLKFKYDIECIVDDWIFMGFLVGNDFIPHLPNLHISADALPLLYKTYMKILPNLDGYINEQGKLNLTRLEVFMEELAIVDRELFQQLGADFKYMNADKNMEAFNFDVLEAEDELKSFSDNMDLEDFIKMSDEFVGGHSSDDETEILEQEFTNHKRNYYITKMKYPDMTSDVIAEQTECYIRALQWTLSYYYHGVQSWSWYYPHHYAPYISDVQHFKNLNLTFDMGKPFLPFEQLLGVLPAASKNLLPEPYRRLMTDPNSSVIEYYPAEFETDLNGKKQDWEAVVLIPFIDENRLLAAMRPCYDELTAEEKGRNIHGPMCQYDYDNRSFGKLDGQFGMPALRHVFCEEKPLTRDDVYVPEDKLVLGPSPNSLRDVYFPGFPTMKHLIYTGSLQKSRVKVFEQPSRNDNMILNVKDDGHQQSNDESNDFIVMAKRWLGAELFISWPHLTEAKVIKVSTRDFIVTHTAPDVMEKNDGRKFAMQIKGIEEHHMGRLGINFGDIKMLLHVLPLSGREYVYGAEGKMTLSKLWGIIEINYPIQAVVRDITVHNQNFVQFKQVEEVFAKGSIVFMLSTPYYGSKGEVIDPSLIKKCGRIKVNLTVFPEPDFTEAKQTHDESKNKYKNSYDAASLIGISSNLLSRITGSILVIAGQRRTEIADNISKANIGLQLKFTKNSEEVTGYTKKIGNIWLYSPAAIDLVMGFVDKFPDLFDSLNRRGTISNDIFFESDLFPNSIGDNCVDKIQKWLKEQPHSKAERRKCGTQTIETETVAEIAKAVTDLKKQPFKCVTLQVKPHLLYKPGLQMSNRAPDSNAKYRLFDRVIISRENYTVPLGYRGTIIGIHMVQDPNPVRQEHLKSIDFYYDVLFDQPFDEGSSIDGLADHRIHRVSQFSLINVTYGMIQSQATENREKAIIPKENAWEKPLKINSQQDHVPNVNTPRQKMKHQNHSNKNVPSGQNEWQNNSQSVKSQTGGGNEPPKIVPTQHNPMTTKIGGNMDNSFEQVWNLLKKNENNINNDLVPLNKIPVPTFPPPVFGGNDLSSNQGNNATTSKDDINPGTNVLRKLLGLQIGGSEIASDTNVEHKVKTPTVSPVTLPSPCVDNKNLTLEKIFEMAKSNSSKIVPPKPGMANFPQPPPNWKQGTFSKSNQQQPQQQTKKSHVRVVAPPTQPILPNNQNRPFVNNNNNNSRIVANHVINNNFINPPLPPQPPHNAPPMPMHPNVNFMHYPQPMNPPFFHHPQAVFGGSPQNMKNMQDNNHGRIGGIPFGSGNFVNTTRPRGPQNLSNNTAHPAGHGAFIPLQAIRNTSKRHGTSSNSSGVGGSGSGGGGDGELKIKSHQLVFTNSAIEVKNNLDVQSNSLSEILQQKPIKVEKHQANVRNSSNQRQPRQSRIAAKFGAAQN